MTTTVLATSNLTKRYGSGATALDALKGVSIEIEQGESVAIVGKSGSGKSTLMHILALLDTPTEGVVSVDGTDASTLAGGRLNALRNRTFGFVFQQFFLNANTSVLDNVMLPLKIARIRSGERTLDGCECSDVERSTAARSQSGMREEAVNGTGNTRPLRELATKRCAQLVRVPAQPSKVAYSTDSIAILNEHLQAERPLPPWLRRILSREM